MCLLCMYVHGVVRICMFVGGSFAVYLIFMLSYVFPELGDIRECKGPGSTAFLSQNASETTACFTRFLTTQGLTVLSV